MGQAPLTGTGCPFPYANTSTTPLCSQLCSSVLGPKYLGLVVACLVVSCASVVLFVWKMAHLYNRYRREQQLDGVSPKQSAIRKSFGFWFFVWWFVVLFVVTSVDIRGYAGVLDPIAYTIMNEAAAASLICVALTLVDFWIACASPLGKSGIPFRNQIFSLVYLNFVGLTVTGLIDVNHFNIYDGTKAIAASIMIAIWALLAYQPTRKIKKTLLHLYNESEEDSKLNVNVAAKNQHLKIIAALDRKFFVFYSLACFGSIIYLVSGIISLRSNDPVFGYRWTLPCEIGSVSIVLRVAQMLACIVAFAFFSVPKGSGLRSDVWSSDKNGAQSVLAISTGPANTTG